MSVRNLCMLSLAGLLLSSLSFAPAVAQGPAPTDKHLQWWRDARFGMFIHWAPISIRGTELSWSRNPGPFGPNDSGIPAAEYDALYKQFNPVKFDPKAIVALAKSAGMKYIVFTTKHHDGFCEWDTKATDFKITSPDCPYGKDIVKQLADACHKAGMHFGIYYSQIDLHHPDYDINHPAYNVYFHKQIHELVTGYGKVDLVWFDGGGKPAAYWDAENLFKQIYKDDPGVVINDRCGLPGDYYTPEQVVGSYDDQRAWETCDTIGDHWSYNPNDQYKTRIQCIQNLARCAGGDGNLLLDIGPKGDGSVDETQADRLHAIGEWMKTHSGAITGTRGGPYKPGMDYVSTRKGNTIFVHMLRWSNGSVTLPALTKRITSSRLLGRGSVSVKQTADGVTIAVPEKFRDAADTVIALNLDGSAMDLAPIKPNPPSMRATMTSSNVYQDSSSYTPSLAFDNDEGTRWATDDRAKQWWLQAELASPAKIGGIAIDEACGNRVQKFEIQYKPVSGGDWITIVSGEKIGNGYSTAFTPVEAKSMRLNILASNGAPTISDIAFTTVK